MGGSLTPEEERKLKSVYERYPFGATDFNTWLKVRLKEVHDKSLLVPVGAAP